MAERCGRELHLPLWAASLEEALDVARERAGGRFRLDFVREGAQKEVLGS